MKSNQTYLVSKVIPILIALLGVFAQGFSQVSGPFNFKPLITLEATEVKSQDNTGTCWSFSATSFIESEILRKTGKKQDLSEMFAVRKIYLEKAVNYLRYHGKANFSQGALAHDQLHVLRTYGMMPEAIYDGKNGAKTHNHSTLEKVLKTYLDSVLADEIVEPHWKERFESILDEYLGACTPVFEYDGAIYNAQTYAKSLGIEPDEYLGFTSFTHHPYYKPFVLEIPDNFSGGSYTNVPLDTLVKLIECALKKGYTVEWDGDVSETGFSQKKGVAVLLPKGHLLADTLPMEEVPTVDLRQARFDSHETTDDHLMHITGIATDQKGKKYFITKNSWGRGSGINGYMYMSESYIRLKTISIYIHKQAVLPSVLKAISSPVD